MAAERPDRLVHRENTFGTPEEDAFRRDFTINALFYDIGTFAIIDYTGGLEDLRTGLVRSIGDPAERFHEDPVRMLRAVAMAARLGFRSTRRSTSDRGPPRRDRAERAGAADRGVLQAASIGAAERAFRMMAERRLLEPIAHELQKGGDHGCGDRWRRSTRIEAPRRDPRHADQRRPAGLAARAAWA